MEISSCFCNEGGTNFKDRVITNCIHVFETDIAGGPQRKEHLLFCSWRTSGKPILSAWSGRAKYELTVAVPGNQYSHWICQREKAVRRAKSPNLSHEKSHILSEGWESLSLPRLETGICGPKAWGGAAAAQISSEKIPDQRFLQEKWAWMST